MCQAPHVRGAEGALDVFPASPKEALGPCPAHAGDCQVVRWGVGLDGLPTWWHADGSATKQITHAQDDEGALDVFGVFVTLPPGH